MIPLLMKRVLFAVLLSCLVALPAASLRAASGTAFSGLVQRYLAESEQRDPLFADSIGIHTYDDRLPDLSPSAQEASYAWERDWRARFVALDPAALTQDERADLRALTDAIDADLLEAATIKPHQTDPSIYTGAIGNAVYLLTSRDYAPLDTRIRAIALRIRFVPDIVRAAEASLTHPPRVAAELAVQQNQGNIDLYEHDLPDICEVGVAADASAARAKSACGSCQHQRSTSVPIRAVACAGERRPACRRRRLRRGAAACRRHRYPAGAAGRARASTVRCSAADDARPRTQPVPPLARHRSTGDRAHRR
ncbi:MAG: DUF885 family protein [Candidatus Eremiobacteraeota bacterium]|nr:DUF885 family protein [Candidatus Eremiobacteraeota bacterium]